MHMKPHIIPEALHGYCLTPIYPFQRLIRWLRNKQPERAILILVFIASVIVAVQPISAQPPEWQDSGLQLDGHIMDMQWYNEQLLLGTEQRLLSLSFTEQGYQLDTLFDRGLSIARIAMSGKAIMVLALQN